MSARVQHAQAACVRRGLNNSQYHGLIFVVLHMAIPTYYNHTHIYIYIHIYIYSFVHLYIPRVYFRHENCLVLCYVPGGGLHSASGGRSLTGSRLMLSSRPMTCTKADALTEPGCFGRRTQGDPQRSKGVVYKDFIRGI